jgi:LytS/YehU family sensor histidine kinase
MLALLATLSGSVGLFAMLAIGQFGVDGALTLAPHIVVRQGTLALLLLALAELRLRHERATTALHDSTVRSLALRRELDAARLAVLSAQIEPHFLFNTLANVRRLLRTEPPAAQQLLGQLRRYLEEALPLLRESHSTLGREAELVRAYLGVHQVRMGPRLAFEVDVPEELGHHPLPPMLLLTLVENALKHGLAPQVEGGTVHVQARRGAGSDGSDELVLTVADTGRGMGAGLGSGTGLANLRARLRTQHGPAARLSLHLHEPRGVRAEVRLPWAPMGTPS